MAKARVIKNLDSGADVAQNAQIIAQTRLEELYEWERYVDDPYRVHELHNLRIAAKRLRYTLEIFAETFTQDSESIIDELTQIQDELGTLHDRDVMIALLRLCLGSQDGGSGYEYVLAQVARQKTKGRFTVDPMLLSYLVAEESAPSAEQRQGLERLLEKLRQEREEQYVSFRQHWYQLKERDFRREILNLLDVKESDAAQADAQHAETVQAGRT